MGTNRNNYKDAEFSVGMGHESLNYKPCYIVTCHHHCYCCNVFSNVIYCFSFADNWQLANLKGDCRTIEAKASRSMVRVLTRRQLRVRDAGWPLCLPCSPQSAPFLLLLLLLLLLRLAKTKRATEGLRCWPLCLLLVLLKVLPPTSSSFSDRQIQTDRHICTNFLEFVRFPLILGAFTLT